MPRCLCVCMYARMHVYVCAYVYMYVCVCACAYHGMYVQCVYVFSDGSNLVPISVPVSFLCTCRHAVTDIFMCICAFLRHLSCSRVMFYSKLVLRYIMCSLYNRVGARVQYQCGYYSNQNAQTVCKMCEPGYYSTSNGTVSSYIHTHKMANVSTGRDVEASFLPRIRHVWKRGLRHGELLHATRRHR